MGVSATIITNNPAVQKKAFENSEIIYLENSDFLGVICFVRDKIHEGHRLLTHPLSGSVKPGETPYKSVLISKDRGGLDMDSLKIIEGSIAAVNVQMNTRRAVPERLLEDFQLIDLDLIISGINSMNRR